MSAGPEQIYWSALSGRIVQGSAGARSLPIEMASFDLYNLSLQRTLLKAGVCSNQEQRKDFDFLHITGPPDRNHLG